jgi:hypothetical protein
MLRGELRVGTRATFVHVVLSHENLKKEPTTFLRLTRVPHSGEQDTTKGGMRAYGSLSGIVICLTV